MGTSKDTVTFNGKVRNSTQRQLAQRVAQQQAKGYKIINSLTIQGSQSASFGSAGAPTVGSAKATGVADQKQGRKRLSLQRRSQSLKVRQGSY